MLKKIGPIWIGFIFMANSRRKRSYPMMKICFGYFLKRNTWKEGNTNTQITSLIPFSARYFRKTALRREWEWLRRLIKSDRLRILPLIGFQVKIISYRILACSCRLRHAVVPFICARIRLNRKITSLWMLQQIVIGSSGHIWLKQCAKNFYI